MSYELAIVGAGNMAEAIVRGVLGAKVLAAGQVIAADVSPNRRELFEKQLGVRAVEDNALAVREAAMVVLSVKPQQMAVALGGLAGAMRADALVISIAAGISTASIEKNLGGGKSWRIIRAMPNTPMLLGEGMVVLSRGRSATDADVQAAKRIFQASATVMELPEDKMDAVTAISGSGPAYFFYLVEQMVQAGMELGLSAEQAHTLATRTALGAAKMMVGQSDPPQELRRKVTSPGGTTQAAIQAMQEWGVPQGIVAALHKAAVRSRELGA